MGFLSLDFTILMLLSGLIGYGLGSMPFGLIITKLLGMGDIRKIGSGNIGATNVLRTGDKKMAVLVLLLDGGKGALAIYLTHLLGLSQWWRDDPAMLAGLMAVIGHNFPIWLQFKGGKGVATSLGVILMLDWLVGLLCLATWLLVALISRYSSLAALLALGLSPAYMHFVTYDHPASALTALLGLLCLIRHRANISRLLDGTESKITLKKNEHSS